MAIASSSLNNMTVPVAGGDGALLMPKLKYRFRVTLQNFGVPGNPTAELTKQVIDFARPSVSFDEIPIEIYNSRIYLAGKHSWEATSLNVRDDATGTVSTLVGQQLQKQLDFYEQVSAAAGIDYKFTLACEILDGGNGAVEPQVLETWTLLGCYLASANYNDLNYGSSEAVTIALSIRFDNAILDRGPAGSLGTNYGFQLGRTVGGAITGAGG